MPRVNRDLERRLAARRERERRRPTTAPRYRFAPTVEEEAETEASEERGAEAPPRPTPPAPRSAVRAPIAKAAPRPFSAYGEEYAYVLKDLRRIVLVVGGLLVFIILLSFVIKT